MALCHTAVVAANLHQGARLSLPGVATALHSGSEAYCSSRAMAHQASESQCGKQPQSNVVLGLSTAPKQGAEQTKW